MIRGTTVRGLIWTETSEQATAQKLAGELTPCLRVHSSVHELIAQVHTLFLAIPRTEPLPLLDAVETLLIRIGNDLRCINILASRGYSVEAAALAAGVCEAFFSLIVLCEHREYLEKWLKHSRFDKPWEQVKRLMRIAFDGRKKLVDPEYEVYGDFCMAKHANPVLQKELNHKVLGRDVVAYFGPDPGDFSVMLAWYALGYSAKYGVQAARTSTDSLANHLPVGAVSLVRERHDELWRELAQLFKDYGERLRRNPPKVKFGLRMD